MGYASLMDAQKRFGQAARRYLPDQLRLLFIAEAPPAFKVNRLFYFTGLTNGDTLFLEMMKVLYPAEIGYRNDTFQPGSSVKLIRNRKPELLRKFQNDGDRKSTRLNSTHPSISRMPSSA